MSKHVLLFPQSQPVVPSQPPPAAAANNQQLAVVAAPQSSTSNILEHSLYKMHLNQYAQKWCLPIPIYQTINEGYQHAPRFRGNVWVDGTYYKSPNTYANLKHAEQDVAKFALDAIKKKMKDDGCSAIQQNMTFCKSILNEYATKMHLSMPTYQTTLQQGDLPGFVCSMVFDNVTYIGQGAGSKKEAEQLVARDVILSIMGKPDSDSSNIITDIVKSKFKPFSATSELTGSINNQNIVMPMVPKGKEIDGSGAANILSTTASIEYNSGQVSFIPEAKPPLHEFKKPKIDTPSPMPVDPPIVFVLPVHEQPSAAGPIVFVPPLNEQPLGAAGPSSGKKKRKKGKKNRQPIPQSPCPGVQTTQVPFSISQ